MPDYLALRAELTRPAYAGTTDAAAADLLNAPDPDNPVPRPFGFGDVMGLLSAASVGAVRDTPNASDLITKINAGDRAGCLHWVGALMAPPAKIEPSEAQAVAALLGATVPGPSRALQTFGSPVSEHEVARARSL